LADPGGKDALEWISSLDCLVASRLHACILALVAGTPLIAVDPNFNAVSGTSKLREFMADAGLLRTYVHMNGILEHGFRLGDLIELALAACPRQIEVQAKMRDAAGAHFDRVADIIQEQPRKSKVL
jgi:polysaccharide pyruvyl transferase WcaK-like protein